MKRLTAIRLINWYHFVDQVFRLDGSLLLLGDNGSGKSTVLDAVQYALVADAGMVRFNRAANDASNRTLQGYVLYKLGTEDDRRPGRQRYGRQACTGYILLEFTDDDDPTASFVCGAALDARENDGSPDRSHFVIPRVRVEDVPAVGPKDAPLTAREFRALLREMPAARVLPDVSTYQAELRHRLGTLAPSFHRLIVRAGAFRPIGQVRQFVLDYLLDERPVNTEALQANLENYKRLQEEARQAVRRIATLDQICLLGERVLAERRTAELHRFLVLRATVDRSERELSHHEEDAAQAVLVLETLGGRKATLHDRLQVIDGERDRVLGLLHQSPTHAEIQRLERERLRVGADLKRAEEADQEARQVFAGQAQVLEMLCSEPARALRRDHGRPIASDDLTGLPDRDGLTARLAEVVAQQGLLTGRDLGSWTRRLEASQGSLQLLGHLLRDEVGALKDEGRQLQDERAELERGRHRYPEGAEALLHLLTARLKSERRPQPLCELIDVRDERWRNAVEGYLNTRRFDVLVAPEDFPRALGLYEKNKAAYPLPGRAEPVFISGVGLVDVEQIQKRTPRAQQRSLAVQIQTDDELARAYCDHLMGDVICVDSEQDLRRHQRAITDTVMVYQGHVARQTDRHVYGRHYIGEAARARRLQEIDVRLGEMAATLLRIQEHADFVARGLKALQKAVPQLARLPGLIEDAEQAGTLALQLHSLDKQLEAIDRSELAELEKEKAALDGRRLEASEALAAVERQVGETTRALKDARDAAAAGMEHLGLQRGDLEAALMPLAAIDRERLEDRYCEERKSREPQEIQTVFERQRKGVETKLQNLTTELLKAKTSFSHEYGFSGDPDPAAVADHERERELWKNSRLPDYQDRIGRAKEEAIQQLAEDVIFKLRENLLSVERHFDELNRALKDVKFGTDRYSFIKSVAPEHQQFHDLIMDAGRFEKDSLFAAQAATTESTRQTLEGLWQRLHEQGAQEVKSELEQKADYREYFNYDLKIHHASGEVSLFDRVAGDKSGGETQTPFYIAILASMARLYRHASSEQRPGCGVVLFDEAFSKMDEKKIEGVMALARSLGLQLLLATPKERSELVAPRVETSLYIHKDPLSGTPTVLDFTKEFHGDLAPAVGQDGATPTVARGV